MAVATVSPTEVGVKVGDFFYTSWGYDQTNVDFYKVVGLTPKGVKVQEWTSKAVSDEGPQVQVVPGDSPKVGCWVVSPDGGWSEYDRTATAPVLTKRLKSAGFSKAAISLESYKSGWLWDGSPKSKTGWGWGH